MKERIGDISAAIERCSRTYPFLRIDTIEHTQSLFKSRLWLSENLYIQIYANDKHPKRSFALISFDRRIFGKDFMFGQWHRHRFATIKAVRDASKHPSLTLSPTQLCLHLSTRFCKQAKEGERLEAGGWRVTRKIID